MINYKKKENAFNKIKNNMIISHYEPSENNN